MVYLRLIAAMIRQSLQQEMAFRLNFFINLLNTILLAIAGIGGIYIVFNQIRELQGWNFTQALSLVGVYLFVIALNSLVISPSLGSLAGMDGDLWFGRFDYTLLKPVATQFYVSIRKWRLWAIVDLTISLVIIIFTILQLNIQYSVADIVAFFYSLVIAMSIMYAILLIVNSCAFWFHGIPVIWLYDSIIQTGRYPVGIYPGWLNFILTWIIPVGFIITVPAKVLVKEYTTLEFTQGTLIAVALLWISSYFFKLSIKRYSSASS